MLKKSCRRTRKQLYTRGVDSSFQPQTDTCQPQTNSSCQPQTDKTLSPAASQHLACDSQSLQNTLAVTSDDPASPGAGCSVSHYSSIDTVSSHGSSPSALATNVSEVRPVTPTNLHYRAREKQSKVSWTLSSFNDIKQMSSPTMDTLPVTVSHKLKSHKMNLSHGSFSRCRYLGSGVQKLWTGESPESIDQISDVESDTEIDTVNPDADIVGSDIETLSSLATSVGEQQPPDDSVQQDEAKVTRTITLRV